MIESQPDHHKWQEEPRPYLKHITYSEESVAGELLQSELKNAADIDDHVQLYSKRANWDKKRRTVENQHSWTGWRWDYI